MIPAIRSYLEIRRRAGFQLRVEEGLLLGFARFSAERGEAHIRASTAISWAAVVPSSHQRAKRLDTVRAFARHVRVEDACHEIPSACVFSRRRPPFLPFLFTPEQIQLLLAAAAQLKPTDSLRPWTYRALFSLLAVTGLRIGEALSLRFADVRSDGLMILETKYRKSRMVPLHPTATAGLERYIERRRRIGGADDHLFVSLRGRVPTYPTVNAVFLGLVRGIGLHPGPGRRGPRLMDLRHTFAVRALEACGTDRCRVDRHIVALSTYMGHAKLASTYWYLHTTAHLLGDVADAAEAFAWEVTP